MAIGTAAAIVGGSVLGGVLSSRATKSASSTAAEAQTAANEASIEEQKRQFNEMQKTLAPYVSAGDTALTAQMALIGLGGEEAQQNAINNIQNSAAYQSQLQAGENAILQNASATGGLRGGNTQSALAQFAPQLLAQQIQNQYSNLGGLTNIGQASAAGQASLGQASANNISSLLQSTGAAQAGQAIASGQANAQMIGGITNTATQLGTLKLLGAF